VAGRGPDFVALEDISRRCDFGQGSGSRLAEILYLSAVHRFCAKYPAVDVHIVLRKRKRLNPA